jgi:hypothetical protein
VLILREQSGDQCTLKTKKVHLSSTILSSYINKYDQFSRGGAREERFFGAKGRQMAVAIAQKLL